MSDFTWKPIYTPVRNKAPKVLTASFGDGYEQRVADGINTIKEVWDLTFRGTRTEIDAIDAFLTTKAGVTSFTWTPVGYSEITVVCDDWSNPIISANTASITAKFRQVFE
jgi:phage-related protein